MRADLGPEPLLDLELEPAGIADAPHRRRRDGDDEGLLDRLHAREQVADDDVGAEPLP